MSEGPESKSNCLPTGRFPAEADSRSLIFNVAGCKIEKLVGRMAKSEVLRGLGGGSSGSG
jgi:hypothetical protein